MSGGHGDQALTPVGPHRLLLTVGLRGAPTGPSGLSRDSGAFFQRSSWELKPMHTHTPTLISAHIPGTTASGGRMAARRLRSVALLFTEYPLHARPWSQERE